MRRTLAAAILAAGLFIPVYAQPAGGTPLCPSDAYPAFFAEGTRFFSTGVAAIAPRQPFDAFFGECPSLVRTGSKTFFVYADEEYDVYARVYDHAVNSLSSPAYVGPGWNDHIRPAVVADRSGYLHVIYGSRPVPLRYHKSLAPADHTAWSVYERVGSSATYPVPIIIGDRLMVMYREGDSYSASLHVAVRDIDTPAGNAGAWTTSMVVERSSVFVPMPLAAFEKGGRACFLFNMRDALLSSPHTSVAPSIREGMSVICTSDGIDFTDLGARPLALPLSYTGDRYGFPEVTRADRYLDRSIDEEGEACWTGGLVYDGSFLEFAVVPSGTDTLSVLVGDSAGCHCSLSFTPGGSITLSDGGSLIDAGTCLPGRESVVRLKLNLSAGGYRPWIDGALASGPLDLTLSGERPDDRTRIDSVTVTSMAGDPVRITTGREYKLITASACVDPSGTEDLFFIDRLDRPGASRWRLMHQRGEDVSEIGDPSIHKYHPSSVRVGGHLLVAAGYFEGEGLFTSNEHLSADSRIVLLGEDGYGSWDEIEIASGEGGHVHPIFKRADSSGVLELVWARMETATSTFLMYGYTEAPDSLFPESRLEASLEGFPNPMASSTTLRLVLAADRLVSLDVFDAAGRHVKTLLDECPKEAGRHDIVWEGDDDQGAPLAPGVYFALATSQGLRTGAKIVLIR